MTTLKFLIVFVCAFFLGMTVFALCQVEGYSPGILGSWTMMWLSLMAVSTSSQIYVLFCEVRIRPKQLET